MDIRHSANNSHTQTIQSHSKKRPMNMKRKLKIYLDTSVISALFDERNPERESFTGIMVADALEQVENGMVGGIGHFPRLVQEIKI